MRIKRRREGRVGAREDRAGERKQTMSEEKELSREINLSMKQLFKG